MSKVGFLTVFHGQAYHKYNAVNFLFNPPSQSDDKLGNVMLLHASSNCLDKVSSHYRAARNKSATPFSRKTIRVMVVVDPKQKNS
jgi:hypothetical protein